MLQGIPLASQKSMHVPLGVCLEQNWLPRVDSRARVHACCLLSRRDAPALRSLVGWDAAALLPVQPPLCSVSFLLECSL